MILFLLLYGTKSIENNGPNGQPAPRMIPSEFYKNMYIQRYRPANKWNVSLYFLLWFDGSPLVTFLFICSKLPFEFLQASSD